MQEVDPTPQIVDVLIGSKSSKPPPINPDINKTFFLVNILYIITNK